MKEIVLASGNKGKIAEFNAMLAPVSVISPKDLGLDFDVEETGKTFFENALIKARALYETTAGCASTRSTARPACIRRDTAAAATRTT